MFPDEHCAGANYSQRYDGLYGWSDERCTLEFPYICELPRRRTPPPSPAPPGSTYSYLNDSAASATRGSTYLLSTEPYSQAAAVAYCQQQGGFLAQFEDVQEQAEVERAFIGQGGLHRTRQPLYWIGYKATLWPRFKPLVRTNSSYTHWGILKPQNKQEPNQFTGPEMCAVANATQVFALAWGWADIGCDNRFPAMCRLLPAPPPTSPPPPPPPGAPDAPLVDAPAAPQEPAPPPPFPPQPPSPRPSPPPSPMPPPPGVPNPPDHPPSPPPPSPRR